jgi:hypothetical protein
MTQPDRSFYCRYQEIAARARVFPHYRDPQFLEKYAQRYRDQLLKARQAILDDQAAFEHDAVFVAFLTGVAPELVEWQAWRVKALALAEQLDSGLPPESERKRQRPTPEQRRENMLYWERVQALDRIERILERRRLRAELQAALRAEFDDLDEEKLEEIDREFKDEIEVDPNDGPYEKL